MPVSFQIHESTCHVFCMSSQVAQHQGYIQINWDRLRSSLRHAEQHVQRTANRSYQSFMANVSGLCVCVCVCVCVFVIV